MTTPDIFTVQARLRRFSVEKKLAHLASLIMAEKPRSFRRAQLTALAKKIRNKALQDCNRFDRKVRRQEKVS